MLYGKPGSIGISGSPATPYPWGIRMASGSRSPGRTGGDDADSHRRIEPIGHVPPVPIRRITRLTCPIRRRRLAWNHVSLRCGTDVTCPHERPMLELADLTWRTGRLSSLNRGDSKSGRDV